MKRSISAVISAFFIINLAAQTMTLDSTFGTNGKTVFSVAAGARCQFCLPQPDGSSILVCEAATKSFFMPVDIILLARLDPTGNLDTSFQQNGMLRIDLKDSLWLFDIRDAEQLPSGDIIVGCAIQKAGQTGISHVLYKFDAQGNPDTSFGVNGVAEIIIPNESHSMHELMLLPNGHILLLATQLLSPAWDINYIMRLKSDGSVDDMFANKGLFKLPLSVFPSRFYLGPDQMIYIIGQLVYTTGPITNAGFLKRYGLDMKEDLAFFNNIKATGFFNNSFLPQGIGFHPDNKILASGSTHPVSRFNYDGKADITFHQNGQVENFLDYGPAAKRILVTPKGKMVFDIGAYSIASLNPNGTFYYGFDYDGILDAYPAPAPSAGNVTDCPYFNLQPDGKVLVAGYFENKVYVARYKE